MHTQKRKPTSSTQYCRQKKDKRIILYRVVKKKSNTQNGFHTKCTIVNKVSIRNDLKKKNCKTTNVLT